MYTFLPPYNVQFLAGQSVAFVAARALPSLSMLLGMELKLEVFLPFFALTQAACSFCQFSLICAVDAQVQTLFLRGWREKCLNLGYHPVVRALTALVLCVCDLWRSLKPQTMCHAVMSQTKLRFSCVLLLQ